MPITRTSSLLLAPSVVRGMVLGASLLLLTGCSGTGTMFTPDSGDAASYGTFSDDFYQEKEGEDPEDLLSEEEGNDSAYTRRNTLRAMENADAQGTNDENKEEPRVKKAVLEGTGSDLYSAQTVDYYYSFALDGTALQLPCSTSDVLRAGWEILLSDASAPIPGYSYEFVSAVPLGSQAEAFTSPGQKTGGAGTIRLCLANFKKDPRVAADCTVCGITVSADSGVSLQTAFGAGLGDTLQDLISVYGTDSSIYSLTDYSDGTRSLQYHFSRGLTEEDRISVLAEAEEKGLAELLLADTDADGETIRTLSLYYFRLP